MMKHFRKTITYLVCFMLFFLSFSPSIALAANTNANLSSITLDDVAIDGFESNTFTYDVNIDAAIGEITIAATPEDANAIITGDTGTQSLSVGANTFTITCTAEDGVATQDYTLNINRAAAPLLSTDATLSDITIDGITIEGFASDTFSYNLTVANTVEQIVVGAIASNDNAQVTGDTGTQSLVVGVNTMTITCTAQDGATTQDYVVNVTRAAAPVLSTDATLSDITIDGSTVTGFASNTYFYDFTVPNNMKQIEVEATTTNTNAQVSGDTGKQSLSIGTNTFTITCTAEDGMTTQDYVVNLTRDAVPMLNNDATLSDISINGSTVEGFACNTFTYDLTVANNVEQIVIATTACNGNAIVSGDTGTKSLSVGENTLTITCTAEDGVAAHDYVLNITREVYIPNITRGESSTDATLSDLTIDGKTIKEFSSDTFTYNITLDYTKVQIDIGATTTSTNAHITGDTGTQSLSVEPKTFTLTCTAEDGTTTQDYVLNIARNNSTIISTTNNAFENLGFVPFDMVIDPDQEVAYITEENGYRIYRVDLSTGEISYLEFLYKAERLVVKNKNIYLTLLHNPHLYNTNGDGSGTIAVIDTATFTIINFFDVILDPYDIEADNQGNVYIGPGSDQHSIIASYNANTGKLISTRYAYYQSIWEYNEQYNKLYSVDLRTMGNPISSYKITDGHIGIEYQPNHDGIGEYIKISPDGKFIFSSLGYIVTCAPTNDGDLIYDGKINKLTSICFDIDNNRFYTTIDNILTAYDYDTRAMQHDFIAASDFVKIYYEHDKLIFLQKNNSNEYFIDLGPIVCETGVSLNKSSKDIIVGDTETLVATVTPSNATNKQVRWSTNNESVATVVDGVVTAHSEGTAVITATTHNSSYTASCIVYVSSPPAVTNVDIAQANVEIICGESFSPYVEVYPNNAANKKLIWSTNNSSVATVIDGKITGISEGNATITTTTEDGGFTDTINVSVVSQRDDITTLSNITVNDKTIQNFRSNMYSYNITVDYSTESINIGATATDINAQISGDIGKQSLTTGLNTFTLTCTAQNGIASQNYVLYVTRGEISEDATLSDIAIDKSTIEGFSSNVYTYEVTVEYTTDQIDIAATTASTNAQVIGDLGLHDLLAGLNTFTITCTAEDGVIAQEYTLNITRESCIPSIGLSNLGFDPFDIAIDPDRAVAYMTEVDGYKLYRVDLNTGDVTYIRFEYIAEYLAVRNGRLYVSLAIDSTNGSIVVIDTAAFALTNRFYVPLTPGDIEADDQGIVYIIPDKYYATSVLSYDSVSGQLQSSLYIIDSIDRWEYNEFNNKLYASDTNGSVHDMDAFEISGGKLVNRYELSYHGDYPINSYMKISPDGQFIFNGSGNIFTCSPKRAGDMIYDGNIDSFDSICFDINNNVFYTSKDKVLRTYNYYTRTVENTTSLQDELVEIFYEHGKPIFLQKNSDGNYYIDFGTSASSQAGKVALLFGIADYTGDDNDLNGPVNDMIGTQAVLEHAGYRVYRYMNYDAADVLNTVDAVASNLSPDSTLLFAYSGHGSDGGYLVGADLNGISINDLESKLSQHTGVKEVIIDACYSGDFIDKNINSKMVKINSQKDFNEYVISVFKDNNIKPNSKSLAETGYYVITACSGDQLSYEFPFSIPNSPFATNNLTSVVIEDNTYYILGYFSASFQEGFGLYNDTPFSSLLADNNSDNILTWNEIYQYAAERTNDEQQAQVYPTNSSHELYHGNVNVPTELLSTTYTIDQTNSIANKVRPKTSIIDFKSNFSNSSSQIIVFDSEDNEVTTGYVGTGMKVKLVIDNVVKDELDICIMGDISGDGIIDITDILYIRAHIIGTYTIENVAAIAAELNNDVIIDITDILYIRAHIIGTYDIHAN